MQYCPICNFVRTLLSWALWFYLSLLGNCFLHIPHYVPYLYYPVCNVLKTIDSFWAPCIIFYLLSNYFCTFHRAYLNLSILFLVTATSFNPLLCYNVSSQLQITGFRQLSIIRLSLPRILRSLFCLKEDGQTCWYMIPLVFLPCLFISLIQIYL